MALQAGDTIGDYSIIGRIGSGGMATIYQAYHKRLGRHAAIKLLHDTFVQDGSFLERFQREARIVARLEHPHIVPIYDYAEFNHQPYLVMKYIGGGTLKRRLIKFGITLEEINRMMTLLADALTYAHQQDVLHRDIKPSNILMDERHLPYITDFGLARIAQAGDSTISHDMMLGTPFYISPEQAKGERDLSPATDVYSFGIILYELLVGTVPFTADTAYAIVHEHIYNPPRPPSQLNPDLTSAVDDVLLKALAKDPASRYQTATALMDDFKLAMAESGVTALPKDRSRVQKTPPLRSRPPAAFPVTPRLDHEPADDSPGRKARVEGAVDMSSFNLNELGQKLDRTIRHGVDYVSDIAGQIESKIKKSPPQPTQEELIRQRVEKKLHARRDLIQHLAVYLTVNGIFWLLYLSSGEFGFPWPIFITGFWGIGVVSQYVEFYYKHGRGAEKREAEIEEEVTRQMRLSQQRKSKVEADEAADVGILDLDSIDAHQVRLKADGELTDSFIDQADDEKRAGR